MLVKHISCDCKCKLNSSTCSYNQKWNNDVHVSVKSIVRVKKIMVGILAYALVRIVDT